MLLYLIKILKTITIDIRFYQTRKMYLEFNIKWLFYRLKHVVSEHNKKRTYYNPPLKNTQIQSLGSLRELNKHKNKQKLPVVIGKNEKYSKLLSSRKSSTLQSSRLKINSRYLSPKENMEYVTNSNMNSSRSSTQSYYRKQIYSQKNIHALKRGSLFTPQNRSNLSSTNSSFNEINHKLEELNRSIGKFSIQWRF